MFTDVFESSGGWVALLIIGIIAVVAAIVAIFLRLQGDAGDAKPAQPRGPSTAPGAPQRPPKASEPSRDQTPLPPPPQPRAPPEPPRPATAAHRRTEGVGSGWEPPRGGREHPPADARKFDRRPATDADAERERDEIRKAERAPVEAAPPARPAPAPPPVTMPGAPAPAAPPPRISPEAVAAAAAAATAAVAAATAVRELQTRAEPLSPAIARAEAPQAGPPVGVDQGNYVAVTVHYGTDRRDLGDNPSDPAARYSADRADTTAAGGTVRYGTCTVSIPKVHVAGGLEDRSWWQWTTGQARTPDQHVMVVSLNAQQPELFFSTLASAVARSSKKDAFVFVHGFSVSFADAARRTAQMAYDLRFEGAPIFFSWPTPDLLSAPLTAYTTSEGNAELSKHRLRAFLQDVLEKSGAETLHVIAHSMGNRLVTEALQMLDSVSTEHLKPKIGEVILTAPDIDTAVFNEIIAPRLTKFAPRVTLYASTRDRAIGASEGAHSNPRIGDFMTLLTSPAGVEVIDASGVDAGTIGHSYYGDNEAVIADLCYLLNLGDRAARRTLTLSSSKTPGGSPCWSVMTRSLTEVYTAIAARQVS